jgi:hypothetical protein
MTKKILPMVKSGGLGRTFIARPKDITSGDKKEVFPTMNFFQVVVQELRYCEPDACEAVFCR